MVSFMRAIGIVGGVGAGKSRVLQLLEEKYHARVIRTDEIAHQLMEPGRKGYEQVLQVFGTAVTGGDGRLDRSLLSSLIFHDSKALETMNGIIHPLVWAAVERELLTCKLPIAAVETALPGKKLSDICNEIWYVYTSRENRIQRLCENRGYSADKSKSIMKSQLSDEEFCGLSDYVIDNNGSEEDLAGRLDEILRTEGG